ncbi:MAG: 50S ribosomal protein L9 [FCB group bacterium]|nr:50S ribosomal protein L9 [FCB group bacterium]
MKVILRDNVAHLGSMGDTVKVADGYARNFLLPRQLAVPAESGSAKQIAHEVHMIRKREEKRRVELRAVAAELQKLTVEVRARAGEEEKIFGSVTAANIAEKLKEQGHDIDKRNIKLEEPIKALGIYTVAINLGNGVEANVKVWVAPIEEEKTEKAEKTEES